MGIYIPLPYCHDDFTFLKKNQIIPQSDMNFEICYIIFF